MLRLRRLQTRHSGSHQDRGPRPGEEGHTGERRLSRGSGDAGLDAESGGVSGGPARGDARWADREARGDSGRGSVAVLGSGRVRHRLGAGDRRGSDYGLGCPGPAATRAGAPRV